MTVKVKIRRGWTCLPWLQADQIRNAQRLGGGRKHRVSGVWFEGGVFRIFGKVLGIYLKYFSTPSLPSALKWEAWTLDDNGTGDPDHQHGAGAGAWAWVWVRINFYLYYFIFY